MLAVLFDLLFVTLSAKYTLDTVFTLTSALVSTSQTALFSSFDIIYKVAMPLLPLRPRWFGRRCRRHILLQVPLKAGMSLEMLILPSSNFLQSCFSFRGAYTGVSEKLQSWRLIEHTYLLSSFRNSPFFGYLYTLVLRIPVSIFYLSK